MNQVKSDEDLKKRVIDALKEVYDPEIPVDIYNLGLVYDIEATSDGRVKIILGVTSPTCPLASTIALMAEETVKEKVPEAREVRIEVDYSRPWDPTRVTPEGRRKLKEVFGYDVVGEMLKRYGGTVK